MITLVSFCILTMPLSYVFFFEKKYSDNYQSTLKCLKDTEVNIWNVLIITGNLNIRDNNWDPLYPFHSSHSNILLEIADSFNLNLFSPVQQVPTWYSNNANNSNSVINLSFLCSNSIKINKHTIYPNLQYLSNHALLNVDIFITEEFIQNKCQIIIKNSEEKENFISDLIKAIGSIDIMIILNKDDLENIFQEYTRTSEIIWYKHPRYVNVTRRSKDWWNKNCQIKLRNYRSSKLIEDWKSFKSTVKKTKRSFFDDKIQEITSKNWWP